MRRYSQAALRRRWQRQPSGRPNSVLWKSPPALEPCQADFTKQFQLINLSEQFVKSAHHAGAHPAQFPINAHMPGKLFAIHPRQRQCPGPAPGADGKRLPRVEHAACAPATRFSAAPPIPVETSPHQWGVSHRPSGLPLEQFCERANSLARMRRLRLFVHFFRLKSSLSHNPDICSNTRLVFR